MTVLDQGQRYLRLDEHQDAPTIEVAEGVTFVATANIGNEYTATRAMDRALVDRFIVVEMETLNKVDESALLSRLHPNLETSSCDVIAEIAEMTRKDVKSDDPKLSTAISTRLCVELAGLMEDGFTLDEANKTIENFINKAFSENINKLIIVTGKGLHSENEKDPYVSKDLSILKYSVPEFISNNASLMSMINEITDAKIEDGGTGAFYIYLKKNKLTK